MPIQGLTTNNPTAGTGLPELGRLRKGGPKRHKKASDGREYDIYGEELDYFRLDWTNPQASPEWSQAFIELYGEQPKNIPGVMFLSDDPDQIFQTWKEDVRNGIITTRCDGVTVSKHWTPQGFSREPIPCMAPNCKCRNTARLIFRLPELEQRLGLMGTFLLPTTSKTDMAALSGFLKFISERGYPMAQTVNNPGMRFVLSRRTGMMTFPNKDGSPSQAERSFVELSLDPAWVLKMLGEQAAQAQRELASGGQLSIPAYTQERTPFSLDSVQEFQGDEPAYETVPGEIVEDDPYAYFVPKTAKFISETDLAKLYAKAKKMGLSKDEAFAAWGIDADPLTTVNFPVNLCMEALSTYAMAVNRYSISKSEVANIIGVEASAIQGFILDHAEEARAMIEDFMSEDPA